MLENMENHGNKIDYCQKILKEIQELSFPDVDVKHRDSITNILAHFADMSSGILGWISTVKHCVDLTPNSRPFCSAL